MGLCSSRHNSSCGGQVAKATQWKQSTAGRTSWRPLQHHADVRHALVSTANSHAVFRVGRSSEFLRAISKSSAIKDDVLRYLTIVRSLALSLWLSNDALIWFHAIGFRNYDNIKDITQRANRFWLAGAVCGVLSDLYRLQQNGVQMERARATISSGDDDKKVVSYGTLVAQRKDLQYQTMQDSLEATLAATLLNYVELEPGTFAIVGFIATALGFRTQWKAVNA